MTTIVINDKVVGISGHSGYAEAGKDIVCAGISALAWTLAGALQKIEALEWLEEKDGDMAIHYKQNLQAQIYVDMFATGAEMMEYKYPDNVRVLGRNPELKNDKMN